MRIAKITRSMLNVQMGDELVITHLTGEVVPESLKLPLKHVELTLNVVLQMVSQN